ncbi:MAG: hypothetical protein FJW38_20030 [Acidobacteria bacterium]|nr:hypothetical protein [Acidobacteriota bacterium]
MSLREPLLVDCGDYVVAQGRDPIDATIASYPLFSAERLELMLAELRAKLRHDEYLRENRPRSGAVVEGIGRFAGEWFQRLDFPEHGLNTVLERHWHRMDEGGVNTLGRHFSSEEACLLRPWPKWLYLREHLPKLRGKSIMEVGSCNGFFPFRFAELGAERVTAVEVLRAKHESAVWANSVYGWRNIEFVNTDFMVDFTIEPHVIVFVSEVVNHLLCPLWAVARLLSLARETLLLDTGVFESNVHAMELSTGWRKDDPLPRFLSYNVSDGLFVSFFKLLGIRDCDITKFVEAGAGHILYRIDTRYMHANNLRGNVAEAMRRSLAMELTLPEPSIALTAR